MCFPLEFFLYVLQPIVMMAMVLGGGWTWRHSQPAQAHTWLVGVAGLSAFLFIPHLRRYVAVNAVLLWGLIALLVGQRVSDRWDTSLKTAVRGSGEGEIKEESPEKERGLPKGREL